MLIHRAGVDRDFGLRAFEVFLIHRPSNMNAGEYVADMTFEPVDEAERIATPIVLSESAVQQIFDDLWNLGVRPTRDVDVSNIVDAKNDNLTDLRGINGVLLNMVKTTIGGTE